MSLDEIIKNPLRRLNPHRGLVIDVPTWSAAHDYHRTHQRLHTLAMHSTGVVAGLEVAAWNPPDNSVVIYPGLAVDADGNTIIVGEAQRFRIQNQEKGTVYIALRYREVPQEIAPSPGEEDPQPMYILQGYTLEERPQLPDGPYVELARIQASSAGATISDARNLQEPRPNEIDLRYRMVSGPRPLGRVAVGLVPLESTPDGVIRHQPGAMNLVRSINATTDYRAEFKGAVNLNQEIRDCHVVLLAGQEELTMTENWEHVLANFLERGGVLLGEACGMSLNAVADAALFQQSFIRLAERLGRQLEPVERGHALLTAHHLFAEPPEGTDGQTILATSNGIVYSNGDYGCLWDGGRPGQPAPRASIRSAIEFGINLGVYSAQRVYQNSIRMAAQ